ncbi:MAG: CHAD domain-containing protein [Paracoccaceae bacterium]
MTLSESNLYHLPADAVSTLAARPVASLKPVLTLDEATVPFVLLDDFDQSLCRSGRLLIETGNAFELLTPDGRIRDQTAQRKGKFVADFAEGPVKSALADHEPLRSLLAVGSGQLRRGQLVLLDDQQQTQGRAHLRVLTETATGTAPGGLAIITFQGLRGPDAALRAHIAACGGTAMALNGPCPAFFAAHSPYDSTPEVAIAPKDTAFAAATDIIATYIPVARANEPGIIADHDTEFLHDYRVAMRKIRSVLSLVKGVYAKDQTKDLKIRFSALMAPTGRLRDLDVHLLESQLFYDLVPDNLHPGLARMFELFAEERHAQHARLARHFQSKAYDKKISQLARLFDKRKKLHPGPMADQAARDYASTLIWDRYRVVCKTAAHIGADTEDAEVHRLRIHCKKLRYLMEFFGPLFPKSECKSLLKPLKELQDTLGLFNDYAVQQVSLQTFIRTHWSGPRGISLEVAQSVGALSAVLLVRQIEERSKVFEAIARFNSPDTRATFQALFHTKGDQP